MSGEDRPPPQGALDMDPELLEKLLRWRMPFGKYEGRPLLELPEPYVVWFHQQGYPGGKLGDVLRLLYEIKLNGLEPLLRPLMRPGPGLD